MRRVQPLVLALLAVSCRIAVPFPDAARPGVATSADELFAMRFVPELALTLDAHARDSLTEHPARYVAATLAHGGRTYAIRVKLKGNQTFRRLDDKPSLHIKFDQDGFLGLHGLVLNNMIDDATGLHELLAYRVYRAAGVPAPRAAFARLTIDGVPYGTYLMVEPMDSHLLDDALGAAPKAVFKGEYGCDVYPADAARIELKHGGDEARDAFTSLATAADRPGLFDDAATPLDVPEVVSYLATTTLVGDFDGYWHSHNYYLAQSSRDGRWRIMPWGNDRVFRDSLDVYGSQGRLARLCFADHDCRVAYARRLAELAGRLDRILPPDAVRDAAAVASALMDHDVKSTRTPSERADARAHLRDYLARRPAEIRAALPCVDGGTDVDHDGDGYGCMDCDDRDPAIHPGATEACDGVDNDCDGLADDSPLCPCQDVSADGGSFQLCDLPMSWASARDYCAARGLTLARFDSVAQARAVSDKAIALRYDRWWLGARQADDGTFGWVDGAAFDFTWWASDEPKNKRCEQSCLVLQESDQGEWALGDCQLYFPFVCRTP